MERPPLIQPSGLLGEVSRPHAERTAEILAGCPMFELSAGEPHFRGSFPDIRLLAVERGVVVVRSAPEEFARSIITCEAGSGQVLLPPTVHEVLLGLIPSRVIGITTEAREQLFDVPTAGLALVESLEIALSQKQEALGNFAHRRHIERVRHKLLQLAESHGRVVRDGIRIDFPVSHTLLADMIGSSRETVTRAFDELQRSGFVARSGRTYRLLVTPERVLGQAASESLPKGVRDHTVR
jgi:biotin operon repressor